MRKSKFTFVSLLAIFCVSHFAYVTAGFSQDTAPAPGAPKAVKVPAVQRARLPNGLTVVVISRKSVPLVSVNLLIGAGASLEDEDEAGIANMTASLLTKGTKTRSATEIAEAIEFLGGDLSAGAGWNATNVSLSVTSDKLSQAMSIMSDVVLNPTFSESELNLAKSQALDGLTYNLTQPSFLSNYVSSKYVFGEHPASGTPTSIKSLTSESVRSHYERLYQPAYSTLIFAGDITLLQATMLAKKHFRLWPDTSVKDIIANIIPTTSGLPVKAPEMIGNVSKILVIDLPKSGQASVSYAKRLLVERIEYTGSRNRTAKAYYPGLVSNSVLGGGYSSRLNYEIRIKRGLSYGAGSSIAWRMDGSNFSTRAQTKNESAPEVAMLVMAELKKLTSSNVSLDEVVPRKSVLTGEFGRSLEKTSGLANAIADLMIFDIPVTELNAFVSKVNSVTTAQIKEFATTNLLGGDIVIVGDYAVFKDDLAKRFPAIEIEVIKADELDLSKDNLRK